VGFGGAVAVTVVAIGPTGSHGIGRRLQFTVGSVFEGGRLRLAAGRRARDAFGVAIGVPDERRLLATWIRFGQHPVGAVVGPGHFFAFRARFADLVAFFVVFEF